MIKLHEIKRNINEDESVILSRICKKLNVNKDKVINYEILKESIDARKKPNIFLVYEVAVSLTNEEELLKKNKDLQIYIKPEVKFNITGTEKIKRPVIVGTGPAGLFAAYLLAELGYKPLIIERGEEVEKRIKTVNNFWETKVLNKNSNVQFGEGGAGTFSDGKLNTMVKDSTRQRKVFETFIEHGAPSDILYKNKPHIGTDKLVNIVSSMRKKIISLGGEYLFNTQLTNLIIKDNKLIGIEVNNNKIIDTDICILAIGHSARDTFYMLNEYLEMTSKPFAVGIRIMHPQKEINKAQYGVEESEILGNADYKLTHQCKNGKGVYTFCMCPGGYVVNASSEDNRLAINGMSNYDRNSGIANSAVVVTVNKDDFGPSLFAGLEFQRKLEEKAYEIGKGNIPISLYEDYKNNKVSKELKTIKPEIKGTYTFANLNEIFPDNINESLKEGIEAFAKKIPIYNNKDSVLAGVESRTSSPIHINRDDNLEANIKGIYPCGEGAGYAGGITSAAIDGIRVVESIISKYKV